MFLVLIQVMPGMTLCNKILPLLLPLDIILFTIQYKQIFVFLFLQQKQEKSSDRSSMLETEKRVCISAFWFLYAYSMTLG